MYCLELAGEDDAFAAREAATAASAVERVAPGLATARGVDPAGVRGLAYTHAASELVGRTEASVEAARALLSAAGIDREGSVAVRARRVRQDEWDGDVSTSEAERALGGVLTDRGFTVDLDDPDHELRVLFSDGVCLVGWLAVESVRDYGSRRPTDRPFFQPGSMAPLDARALANLALEGASRSRRGDPGRGGDADGPGPPRLLDPMCGTGGLLIEGTLVGADVVGVDAQWKMVRGAAENVRACGDEERDGLFVRGDATGLPLRDDAVDGVAFDAPYGRQSKVARHELADLVGGALSEAHRVAPRAVLVADRSWRDAAEDAGWTVERVFVRRVHGSLDRHVHLLHR